MTNDEPFSVLRIGPPLSILVVKEMMRFSPFLIPPAPAGYTVTSHRRATAWARRPVHAAEEPELHDA